MVLVVIGEKKSLNQIGLNFTVVEKHSYFHLMNFIHMHLLIYISNNISSSGVLKKIPCKA